MVSVMASGLDSCATNQSQSDITFCYYAKSIYPTYSSLLINSGQPCQNQKQKKKQNEEEKVQ